MDHILYNRNIVLQIGVYRHHCIPFGAEEAGHVPLHVHEETREAGWDDEEILEALAAVALEWLAAMVNVAGDIPADGATEEPGGLRAA